MVEQPKWRTDGELFRLIRSSLYSPVVGDALDSLGLYHQFLPQPIQPIRADMMIVGRAMPVLVQAVDGPQPVPFGRLTEALDQLRPGEVYVAAAPLNCASWGEILTATARMRGAVGAVIDGFHRDTQRVLEQEWPVFSRGRYAQDAAVRSSVVSFRCPVTIGQVAVRPGDLVFGDLDGVLVVPRDVEVEVMIRALGKACSENTVRRDIEGGASSTGVFRKYGVL